MPLRMYVCGVRRACGAVCWLRRLRDPDAPRYLETKKQLGVGRWVDVREGDAQWRRATVIAVNRARGELDVEWAEQQRGMEHGVPINACRRHRGNA